MTDHESMEGDLERLLDSQGYERTSFVSQLGSYWINRESKRHLHVPNSVDGWYPGWMVDELAERAAMVGDAETADMIRSLARQFNQH